MSLISTPLFKTDKTEALEAQDAYNIEGTRPINKLYDAAMGGVNKLIDRAGGIVNVTNGIENLIRAKKAGATGKELLESGLGMFNTSTIGILKSAGNGILDKAAKFVDLNPTTVEKIKGTGESLYSKLQYADPSDLTNYTELTSLIGGLSGHEEFASYVNVGLESAVWGATLATSVEYGAYNYLGDVKDYVEPEVYHQALVYSTPAVAVSGSLDAYKQLEGDGKLSTDEIMAIQPDFVKTFLTNFKMPETIPSTVEAYAAELVDTLTNLAGTWYEFKRNDNETIFDISSLATASEDARKLLEIHPVIGPIVQIAKYYPEIAVEESMRQQFPMMVTNLS